MDADHPTNGVPIPRLSTRKFLECAAVSHGYVPEDQREDPRADGCCQCGMTEMTCCRGCFDHEYPTDAEIEEDERDEADRMNSAFNDDWDREEAEAMNRVFDLQTAEDAALAGKAAKGQALLATIANRKRREAETREAARIARTLRGLLARVGRWFSRR